MGPRSRGHASCRRSAAVTASESHHLLGLPAPATRSQIVEARRRLSLVHHPDRGGDAALMARINRAADELLTDLEEEDSTTRARPVRTERDTPHKVVVDHPSFVIDVLPVLAHEVLTLAVVSIGEIVDDDPPYGLEFTVNVAEPGGNRTWCRAEIVPDAGSSTVSLVTESDGSVDVERLRDLLVREINALGVER